MAFACLEEQPLTFSLSITANLAGMLIVFVVLVSAVKNTTMREALDKSVNILFWLSIVSAWSMLLSNLAFTFINCQDEARTAHNVYADLLITISRCSGYLFLLLSLLGTLLARLCVTFKRRSTSNWGHPI